MGYHLHSAEGAENQDAMQELLRLFPRLDEDAQRSLVQMARLLARTSPDAKEASSQTETSEEQQDVADQTVELLRDEVGDDIQQLTQDKPAQEKPLEKRAQEVPQERSEQIDQRIGKIMERAKHFDAQYSAEEQEFMEAHRERFFHKIVEQYSVLAEGNNRQEFGQFLTALMRANKGYGDRMYAHTGYYPTDARFVVVKFTSSRLGLRRSMDFDLSNLLYYLNSQKSFFLNRKLLPGHVRNLPANLVKSIAENLSMIAERLFPHNRVLKCPVAKNSSVSLELTDEQILNLLQNFQAVVTYYSEHVVEVNQAAQEMDMASRSDQTRKYGYLRNDSFLPNQTARDDRNATSKEIKAQRVAFYDLGLIKKKLGDWVPQKAS